MEFSSPAEKDILDPSTVKLPLGSTALYFAGPEVHLDPYETHVFIIDDPELNEATDTIEEVQVSYAVSRQDFQLLRRHKQLMRGKTNRARKNKR